MNTLSFFSKLKPIFWFLVFVVALFTIYSLFSLYGFASLLMVILLVPTAIFCALFLTFIGWLIWKYIRNKPFRFLRLWGIFSLLFSIFFLFLSCMPVFASRWINDNSPLLMPRITLQNEDGKEVIYQGMVHIGSEDFYQEVIYELTIAEANGYHIFYEGVAEGTAEAEEKFDEIMGLDELGVDLSELYDGVAEICGLEFQSDYFEHLIPKVDVEPNHVRVDVTTNEIVAEWERLKAEDPTLQAPAEMMEDASFGDQDIDFTAFMDANEQLGERLNRTIATICQAGLSSLLETDMVANNDIELVILDLRDKYLANAILEYEHDKIFITYGEAHFDGVYRLLQEADPSWEITDVQWQQAIDNEPERSGELEVEVDGNS